MAPQATLGPLRGRVGRKSDGGSFSAAPGYTLVPRLDRGASGPHLPSVSALGGLSRSLGYRSCFNGDVISGQIADESS